MRSVVEIGASVPAFLGKLWKLVNDTETNHLISWSPGGKTFFIKNQADFARELLPLYYKHNNMASFIRQLNMYGFHKITSVENGGLRYDKDEIEFSHPCFMRGHAYLLEHIKRKIANPKSIVASGESGEKFILKPELMNKVFTDVKQLKGKQESLDAKFSAMKQENEALWREVAILRQKHIKQQQIVNNLIQFLMSLVQPARPPNATTANVGVKRPYQLMINSAAHNSEGGKTKNLKLDKESLLEDLNEENMEDGPTIHELAHDDILHNDASQDSLSPHDYVSVDLRNSPYMRNGHSPNDPSTSQQYHVTMEEGDDAENDESNFYNVSRNGLVTTVDVQPVPEAISPTASTNTAYTLRIEPPPLNKVVINATPAPSTSQVPKTKSNARKISQGKNTISSNFNHINPSPDLKLPAEIFASDDSVSDAGVNVTEDIHVLPESLLAVDPNSISSSSKDRLLGGINIKVEKVTEPKTYKKTKKNNKDTVSQINLADIKTELQDDLDWNNMSVATVANNDINRFQSMNRRDCISKNLEEYSSLYGPNGNKTDIDDHLDTMQTDLDSLRELLRGDTYALDANTLLGLFGSEDPFYGLTYNPSDDKTKTANNAEGNQLISYSGNIPDFVDLNMPELESAQASPAALSPSSSTLNTPQVTLLSPAFTQKP